MITTAFLPANLVVGCSLIGTVAADAYPADEGWRVEYALRSDVTSYTFSSAAANDGVSHLYSVPFARTGTWTPGDYRYAAYAEGPDQRYQIAFGNIEIVGDGVTTAITQSHARIMLAAINAALEGNASSLVLSNTLPDGAQLTYCTPDQLIKWRSYYQQLVDAEEVKETISSGAANPNVISFYFPQVY